tara:strand:- start:477 stop:740 length:264 start_codon:yes stop_codon:yes gene_type:complete
MKAILSLNEEYKDEKTPLIIKADSDFNSLIGKELSILADLIELASQDSSLLDVLAKKHDIPTSELFKRLSDSYEKLSKSICNEFFYD